MAKKFQDLNSLEIRKEFAAKEKLKIVSVCGEGRIPFELFSKYTA